MHAAEDIYNSEAICSFQNHSAISNGINTQIEKFSEIKMLECTVPELRHVAFANEMYKIFTTSNIRMIPVGVFNGLRSQCIGTPHGADGI